MISKSEKILKSTKQKKEKLKSKLKKHVKQNCHYIYIFFLITDCIALIAVNNLLDIQVLPSIPSCLSLNSKGFGI